MKKQTKKLALQLDTLRHLNDHGLRAVAGGLPSKPSEIPKTLPISRRYCG
ncbi:MAG: hypothetical protein H7138_10190 [Myxococcales bacterium]|nr:hypothetical protein [Myxococcales bacterium]